MSFNFSTNPLFLNTILLSGTTTEKLLAAKAAGFDQVELWQQDLEGRIGAAEVRDTLATSALELTDYQVLLDFDGAPEAKRASKRQEALHILDTALAVGASTVLVPASTDGECVAARVVEDMGWLAEQAAERNLRIAYEGMAWSTVNCTLPAAWALVRELDQPNLGLVVDAFHIFARGRTASDLDGIPMDRIFLVQLSDCSEQMLASTQAPDANPTALKDLARHRRQLPGRGRFPLTTLLDKLRAGGYSGPLGLEVFNDALKARPPEAVALEAFVALQQILQR